MATRRTAPYKKLTAQQQARLTPKALHQYKLRTQARHQGRVMLAAFGTATAVSGYSAIRTATGTPRLVQTAAFRNRATGYTKTMTIVGGGRHGAGTYYIPPSVNLGKHSFGAVFRVPRSAFSMGMKSPYKAIGPATMHTGQYVGRSNLRRNIMIGGGITAGAAAAGGAAYLIHRHNVTKAAHHNNAHVHTHRAVQVRRGAHGHFAGSY